MVKQEYSDHKWRVDEIMDCLTTVTHHLNQMKLFYDSQKFRDMKIALSRKVETEE